MKMILTTHQMTTENWIVGAFVLLMFAGMMTGIIIGTIVAVQAVTQTTKKVRDRVGTAKRRFMPNVIAMMRGASGAMPAGSYKIPVDDWGTDPLKTPTDSLDMPGSDAHDMVDLVLPDGTSGDDFFDDYGDDGGDFE